MIKKMAWNTFKNTGNIEAFLEFKTIENVEEDISAEDSLENPQSLLLKQAKE